MIDRLLIDQVFSRVIYFINTIDSYIFIAAIISLIVFFFIHKSKKELFLKNKYNNILSLLIYAIFLIVCFKLTDFHFYFIFFTPVFLYFFFKVRGFYFRYLLHLFIINIIVFFLIQFIIISVPFIFILKDLTIPFRTAFNSIFSLSPTILSASISIYFATFLTTFIYFKPKLNNKNTVFLILTVLIAAIIVNQFLPVTPESEVYHPETRGKISERVVLITVDGWRFDKFKETLDKGELPYFKNIIDEGIFFENGATCIYRALTEPGLVTFLTGLPPELHGVKHNSFIGNIKNEIFSHKVKTNFYGNVHMGKTVKNWNPDVVSLSIYGWDTDNEAFRRLKEDILNDSARLYFADFGDVDLTGHAYGSYTKHYIEAIKRVDKRIGDFISFLKKNNLLDSTTIIISSEHGQTIVDHGYFHVDSEKYVPLIIYGNGIKKGISFDYRPSIIDVNPTIMYILGIDYLKESRGKVLIETFK